jgi:GNAT superfamily N-acetyltransferase
LLFAFPHGARTTPTCYRLQESLDHLPGLRANIGFQPFQARENAMRIVIEKYSAAQLDAAISLLSEAFVTNPLHVAAFGPQRIDQNRLFFRIGLRHMFAGQAFVARVNGQVLGYVHFNASPHCLPAPEEIPTAAATVLRPLGAAIPNVINWFARWCHLDPDEPHVHLGPIGVAPGLQGRGVGTALMNRYIEHLKQEQSAGYLETDRPENVEFYQKFGFVVQHQEQLIGAPTWYMWRRPPENHDATPPPKKTSES